MVGVMSTGRLEQIAAPTELYDRPMTPFVAEFVGLTNRIGGTASDGAVEILGTRIPLLEGSATSGEGGRPGPARGGGADPGGWGSGARGRHQLPRIGQPDQVR